MLQQKQKVFNFSFRQLTKNTVKLLEKQRDRIFLVRFLITKLINLRDSSRKTSHLMQISRLFTLHKTGQKNRWQYRRVNSSYIFGEKLKYLTIIMFSLRVIVATISKKRNMKHFRMAVFLVICAPLVEKTCEQMLYPRGPAFFIVCDHCFVICYRLSRT